MPSLTMLWIFTSILFGSWFGLAGCQQIDEEIAAVERSVKQYCALHGMNATAYDIVTSDEWVLTVFRIQSAEIFDSELSTPVLLSHGFSASSFDFMANLRNESLAFVLADNGFDVWCINYRANQFSNEKLVDGEKLKPLFKDYYKVSWQEMADRDLPAVIDTVLAETKQDKLNIVGHSMGGTVPFAFFSQNHTYDDKIGSMELLAPVLKWGPDVSPMLKTVLSSTPLVLQALNIEQLFEAVFGDQLFAMQGETLAASINRFAASETCKTAPVSCMFISQLVLQSQPSLVLEGNSNLNSTRMPLLFRMYPGGLTMMTAYQFGFQWTRDPWTKIDYSTVPIAGIKNIDEYGTEEPPEYDFTAVKVNYTLWYTDNDVFTGVQTAKKIIKEFGVSQYNYHFVEDFTHPDVVWAWNARCFIYDEIIRKFDLIEQERGDERKSYRARVEEHVAALGFPDGCADLKTSRRTTSNIITRVMDRFDLGNIAGSFG